MKKIEMKRMVRRVALLATVCGAAAGAGAQERLMLSAAECREMALAHNEDLQKADNALRQAELDKAVAFAGYLPKVDATAMGGYVSDMDMMGMELQMRGLYMAGISLTQPLYVGGQIMAGNKLADIGRECAGENRRKTRMEVIADADRAYWNYISVSRYNCNPISNHFFCENFILDLADINTAAVYR